jgi:hypothetical protein
MRSSFISVVLKHAKLLLSSSLKVKPILAKKPDACSTRSMELLLYLFMFLVVTRKTMCKTAEYFLKGPVAPL